LLVGDAESIAEKILYENDVLGGISRMTILVNGGVIPHKKAMHAIEILGTRVAPMVKKELGSRGAWRREGARELSLAHRS
jgi:hypothetical protein